MNSRPWHSGLGAAIGFVLGFAAGLVLHATGHSSSSLTTAAAAIGTLWTNAFRAIVIPLIITGLIVVFAGASAAHLLKRLSSISLAIFCAMMAVASAVAILAGPPLIKALPLAAGSLTAAPASHETATEPSREDAASPLAWVDAVIAPNPIKAAADGAILPLLVFTIAFALALARLTPERREPVLALCRSVRETLGVLIEWTFAVAPLGIFALALALTARVGSVFIGTMGYYVLLQAIVMVLMTLIMYLAAMVLGGVSLRRFATALIPAQLVAISTRSSMASLPAMLEGATERLGLQQQVAGFTLSLAVSVLRLSQSICPTVRLLFVAYVYGIALSPAQVVTFAITISVLSFGRPGLPVSGGLTSVPLMLALGLPIDGVLLFRAADTMLDVFMTLLNVTSDMTAATLLARFVIVPESLVTIPDPVGQPS
jgi:proton glutamate symport protein